MNKNLVFLTVLGVLLLSVGLVMADETQDAEVTVQTDTNLIPTPNPINFGDTLKPGDESIREITLVAGTSDLQIDVGIVGDSIIIGMMHDIDDNGLFDDAYNGESFIMSAQGSITFDVKIIIPIATPASIYAGTITYTVMEAPV